MLARAVSGLPAAFRVARCKRTSLEPLLWSSFCAYVQSPNLHFDARARASASRNASTSSSTRWKARQTRDTFAREAKVAGLKSRAAFKLLEINEKHKLFKRGDTVVDLGYAPGSWSQVAINRTSPGGRVIGIDIIPAQPPRGVSTIQGNFLSEEVREEVRRFVQDPQRGRPRSRAQLSRSDDDGSGAGLTAEELEEESKGLIERERDMDIEDSFEALNLDGKEAERLSQKELDAAEGRVVNVVLSDMSEPWPLTASTWIRSVSNPYHRMQNTSGMAFRDHAGSMDLCNAALIFCYDTLITGGHFVCKFYQGAEDKALENRLKALFEKVHRIKPDSSRKESKEAYFVCLRRRAGVHKDTVFDDEG